MPPRPLLSPGCNSLSRLAATFGVGHRSAPKYAPNSYMYGFLPVVLVSGVPTTSKPSPRWCRTPWRHGSCGLPVAISTVGSTSCWSSDGTPSSGTWSGVADAAACARLCRGCGHCSFVSYSPLDSDCSWFARCDTLVQIKAHGFKRVVANQSRSKPITDRRHCTLAASDLDAAYPPTWFASHELLLARGVISLGSQQNARALLRMVRAGPGRSNQTSVLGIGSSVTQYGGGGLDHCVRFPSSNCREDGFLMQAINALNGTRQARRHPNSNLTLC